MILAKKFASNYRSYDPEPVVGCMVDYATNYNPSATVSGSCTFPDNSGQILIIEASPESVTQHGVYVLQGLNEGYGADLSEITIITGKGFSYGSEYANDTNFKMVLYSYIGAGELEPSFIPLYPASQGFMPLGSNLPIELMTPTSIPVMVTAGAGSDQNGTGYGMGLEFFDNEHIGSLDIQSSFSNGVIAGKLLKIKEEVDSLSHSFWKARYRARITATRTLLTHPNGEIWNMYNGYGIIDVQAAINYEGTVPPDPLINGGNVYTPHIP